MHSAAAYTQLRAEIPDGVRLIAVSKQQSLAAIESVYAAGCRDFGENYLQEAILKITQWRQKPIVWHFIGRIQSNKIKDIAAYFDVVHSVDRLDIALKLDAACARLQKIMPIFIQVNVDREPQKAGVLPEDLPPLLTQLQECDHLAVQGLMSIPALGKRAAFAALRSIGDQLDLPSLRLSMGMSQDYALAIAEGATDVRVGEAIFGARMPANQA
jgi:pyridoxal phosphate enzyme (YggS family)